MSDELNQLLEKVQDEEVRNGLNDLYAKWTGSALRSERDDAVSRAEAAEAKNLTFAFREAGFDPNTGQGKALAKLYEGEADPEAIQQFAKDEFDFQPTSAENGDGENGETPAAETPQQTGDERLAQVAQGSIPARSPSTLDELKKAEAEGRVNDAVRLNLQLQREQSA